MKSFLIAVFLAAAVLVFVVCNMIYIDGRLDRFDGLCALLPTSEAEFEARYAEIGNSVETLWTLWDESFSRIALTTGYDNINRADDAMLSLYNAYKNRDGDDFSLACRTLSDSLRRLRELESVRLGSIF